jgi:hypothetical protein
VLTAAELVLEPLLLPVAELEADVPEPVDELEAVDEPEPEADEDALVETLAPAVLLAP